MGDHSKEDGHRERAETLKMTTLKWEQFPLFPPVQRA